MMKLIIFSLIFLLNLNLNRSCNIEFNGIDDLNTIRHGYEREIFLISGKLENCPKSISVKNISIFNPMLKRLNILNVSYFIETNQINITVHGRLIGFAPLTIQLYFREEIRSKLKNFPFRTRQNQTIEEKTCELFSLNRDEILKNCRTLRFEDKFYVLAQTINVAIKRHQTIIDILFTAVVIVLVTVGTLCIGCGLETEQLIHNFKRPLPFLVGLFCQIIYVPLLSLGITKTFRLDNSTSLGLLSTATSPGGGSSNIYTALLSGDVDLSVTITFFSTVFAFGTFPFWIWLLGRNYVDFKKTKFPWWSMMLSVLTLFIPALIGFLLRRYRPVLAHRIGRFLNPIAVGYLVFILTFGVYINMFIFYIIDFKSIIACCFLPWFGFIGGSIISFLTIRDKKKIIAICIETGIQNTAVSIFFLRLTFSQPESDLALANPILVSMAIPIPFLILFLTKSFLGKFEFCRKFLPKKQIKNEENQPEKTLIKELLEEKEQNPTS